jgi:hypothetical protein
VATYNICDQQCTVDCIVSDYSGRFPESMHQFFEMMRSEAGRMVRHFAYLHGLALARARKFRISCRITSQVFPKSPVVWLNVPPAFVYDAAGRLCRQGLLHIFRISDRVPTDVVIEINVDVESLSSAAESVRPIKFFDVSTPSAHTPHATKSAVTGLT